MQVKIFIEPELSAVCKAYLLCQSGILCTKVCGVYLNVRELQYKEAWTEQIQINKKPLSQELEGKDNGEDTWWMFVCAFMEQEHQLDISRLNTLIGVLSGVDPLLSLFNEDDFRIFVFLPLSSDQPV